LNLALAGVGSALPAASVAATVNVCLPRLSFFVFTFFGDLQLFDLPLSILHVNVEPSSEEAKRKWDKEVLL
jgi:hypothetical protein